MSSTIKDVAKRAGVSLSTVSLVINQKKNVSEETQKKVQKAIEELNYYPSRSAKGLPSKKSGNIGFILTDDHFSRAEPFYTKIFLGSEYEARKFNYYILLTTVEKKYTRKTIPQFLLERNVDGVVLAGRIPQGLITNIQQYELPMVFIDYLPSDDAVLYSAVLIDNEEGAKLAVNHLLACGHRDIAFIGGDITHPSIESRFLGYRKNLEKAKIRLRDELIVIDEPYTGEKDGYHALCKLMSRNHPFTAVFAANDAMAFGAYQCLKEKNIRIPDDIALVGFDDVDVAWQMEPKLTTIRVNKEEIGVLAVNIMVDMIQKQKKSLGKTIVPVELIVRQSTINNASSLLKKEVMVAKSISYTKTSLTNQ